MISVGLIGCGAVVHTLYAQTLRGRSAYAVRWVSDVVEEQARSAARLYGAEVAALDDLIQRSDAIVIAAPPEAHAALVRGCLLPGKTVLCEKPFTTSSRDAVDLTGAAEAAGARLYVGHFRRTFPQVELARSLVALGLLGEIREISVSEGGRFTWNAVSRYTTASPYGGVWWDTGPHAIDMALFAGGLDARSDCAVAVHEVARDKAEPSHDFRARFDLEPPGARAIHCRVHLSRKDALPNFVKISGERGAILFSVALDRFVRLTTDRGSVVVAAERDHADLTECFDLQLRRVFLARGDEDFAARRFLGLATVLEAVAGA